MSVKDKKVSADEVTKTMMDAWSEKYGKGKCAVITVDGKRGYLRPPTRTEMGAYSVAYRNNPVKANEMLLKQCWLAGDVEIIEVDKLFYAACNQLPELVQAAEAELDRF